MASKAPDQTFTPAERIRQLNDIDQDVAQLLRSAGLAIQALTNGSPEATESSQAETPSTAENLESQKKAFKNASSQYFALLSSIDVKLRRQVYALEEASIIRPESTASLKSAEGPGASASASSGPGGSNPLEISWLNSRKDTVGKDKEAELWAEAKKVATQFQSGNRENGGAPTNDDGKDVMETD